MRLTLASILGWVALATSTLVSADASIDNTCLSIERHFATNNLSALIAVEAREPRWQALQQFRLAAAYIPADERRKAGDAIRKGLKLIAAELKAHPQDIELLILGSMLDGQYLLLRPWRFFINGRRGLSRIARAEALDAENPRIALVRGTAKFILPGFLGGSAKEAQSIFNHALATQRLPGERFQQSTLCQSGEWGQVDLMNWLARAHAKLGDAQGAHEMFSAAAAYSPGNHWVDLALKGEGYEWVQEE